MKRLRFRFRLRTLLIATALLAVLLVWFVDWWQSRQNFQMLTTGSQAMEPLINGRTPKVVDMNAYRFAKPERWEPSCFVLTNRLGGASADSAHSSRYWTAR